MAYKITVVEAPALAELLHSPAGGVARTMLARALQVETMAKRKVKADHGRLRQSITHQLIHTATRGYGVRVGTNVSYAEMVHNGTGMYGQQHRPIVPTTRTFLKFTGASGDIVYARSVRGQQPNPFLTDALDEVMRSPL